MFNNKLVNKDASYLIARWKLFIKIIILQHMSMLKRNNGWMKVYETFHQKKKLKRTYVKRDQQLFLNNLLK